MSGYERAVNLLPAGVRNAALALSDKEKNAAEELRLRIGEVPTVLISDREIDLPMADRVTRRDLQRVLELATGASPYASIEAVKRGYAAAPGGVRVGFCGRFRSGSGGLWALEGVTSAAVRIPREIRGCAASLCLDPFVSSLIVSPPGAGKTTLLRDMVRILSDNGYRVALCDERGEVSACSENGFGFSVGQHTDVLSDLPKSQAALQLIRTMNPQILAMDEITGDEDLAACRSAWGCGVALLATAHGNSREDVIERPALGKLLRSSIFNRLIFITKDGGKRIYREESLG